MSTTRISVIPEAHLNSNKNDVIIMEDDEEDIYHESIIPNDLSISKSLKKLQIDVDSIKHTLKTVVKMLHNISVNKKQKQMLLLELKDSENKEKALSKIVSEEVMKEFNWNGQNDKRAVNVNFLFTSIFNAWKTETFKWADWKKCIDSVCSRSNKRRKENDEKETEDEKETHNDEEPGSIDDDLAFQFPIVDFKEFDEMEARLSSDKPYEKEVMRYVKRLSQTLDHQDILEKLIADHVLEDLNLSGGDGKRSILNSKLFNFIYGNNVGLFYDQRKKDDTEEEMHPTQSIEKSGNITDTQKSQLNSLKNTIEDIQKIFGNEYLDIETFPIKSTEDMDKLIAEVEEDPTTLNKLKAEFISSRSNCAKARKASFRRYFHNDLLVHYNWGGVCGKRSIEREKVFKTLFECWQSETFKYNQFKSFAKNELSLLRCRKAAMVSRKKAKERRENSS